jgi:predicted nuclease of predicted toxin-antitoxin system
MGIPQSTGRYLRAEGHDVVHLVEEGLANLPDDGVVAKAQEERRAIVTHDLDFGRIVALGGNSVPSIVTLRLSDMRPPRVNAALKAALRLAGPSLEKGALVTVTDKGVRVRILPVDVA